MTECFHCDGSGRCDCAFCSPGYEIFEGNMRVAWGECIAPFHGKVAKVKNEGWEPVAAPLTSVELVKVIDVQTKLRNGAHRAEDTMKVDKTKSDIAINRMGVKGEYVVWRETGGDWLQLTGNGKDPGWDIVAEDGTRIEVKATTYRNGHFLPPAHDQNFYADIGFLVLDGPEEVTILGSFTSDDWEIHKEQRDFKQGEGMQWCLNQRWMGDPRRFFAGVTK